MSTTEPIQTPTVGEHGEPCATCAAPLAGDQVYCLNCGQRRGPGRFQLSSYLGNGAPANGSVPDAAAAGRSSEPSPWAAVMGVGLLGVMLLIGVLIGRGNDSGETPAPVVQVEGAGTQTAESGEGSAETDSTGGEVTTDWPQGETGWTIELGTLPKDGTEAGDVEAATADAESTGASDVGVLDSDQYASLPGGNYVIYSGIYPNEADAEAALSDLEANFPDAQVIEVSDEEATADAGGGGGGLVGAGSSGDEPVEATTEDLENLENLSPEEYQDASQDLPDTIVTPGELPEPDGGEPGAGTDAEVIE